MDILGIDIGGSGVKGAPVDVRSGQLLSDRYRIPTPAGAKPDHVAQTVAQIAEHFGWKSTLGCCLPAVVQHGIARTAANIDQSWIGTNAETLFSEATGCPVKACNDADAAGLAEINFGAGKGVEGLVLMVTIGTGLGTALFIDGRLVPNTELGHIEIGGQDAELNASDAARKRDDLSWKQWAKRFDLYLKTMERLFWPDLIILGGGASKKLDKFAEYLTVSTKVVPAESRNEAGIIGAAMAAASRSSKNAD
ncbi:MAG: ROK family protein [Pseudomonadota bacterium]